MKVTNESEIYKHLPQCGFQKGHKINLGKKSGMCGKKHTEETKKKMSLAKKGRMPRNINLIKYLHKGIHLSEETKKKISKAKNGTHLSEETKRKISKSNGGTGIPQRTNKRYYHLRDKKYFEWRIKVFERDSWTCQTCEKRGCYLEPHHIKGWSNFPQLRYEVKNGVTLCYECHKLTRKKH